MANFPWLRRIRVTFSGAFSKVYESNGKQDLLRIKCIINKTIMDLANVSNILIYNLSEDTRNNLQNSGIKVTVEAGWDNGERAGMQNVFYGDMKSAVSMRQGADIVTNIQALSMLEGIAEAEKRKYFEPYSSVESAVRDLAAGINGVTIDKVVGLSGKKFSEKGWSCAGGIRGILNQLGREFAFSWTIQDGKFQAVADDSDFRKTSTIRDPYLIYINPMLATPEQITNGMRIRCVYDPNIYPAYLINVNSKIMPKYNGQTWRVNTVQHSLDCFDQNSFITDISCFIPLGGA